MRRVQEARAYSRKAGGSVSFPARLDTLFVPQVVGPSIFRIGPDEIHSSPLIAMSETLGSILSRRKGGEMLGPDGEPRTYYVHSPPDAAA